MKHERHSSEFASRRTENGGQDYNKGDRVRILATGALATVTYAIHTDRGHFVTLRIDGKKGLERVQAKEIAKIEALF